MNKCKECGKEEWGYGSLLNNDGLCFNCSIKHINELVQKIHILTESQMNLENALGSQADYFKQEISVLESKLFAYSELLKKCRNTLRNLQNGIFKGYAKELLIDIERILND